MKEARISCKSIQFHGFGLRRTPVGIAVCFPKIRALVVVDFGTGIF
jgi:hypothetical protein